MKSKTKINYFVEFKSSRDGKMHWAVHSYDNVSKMTCSVSDMRFDD